MNTLYDAWKVKPPCEGPLPFCSSGCPYYDECGRPDDEQDEDEE